MGKFKHHWLEPRAYCLRYRRKIPLEIRLGPASCCVDHLFSDKCSWNQGNGRDAHSGQLPLYREKKCIIETITLDLSGYWHNEPRDAMQGYWKPQNRIIVPSIIVEVSSQRDLTGRWRRNIKNKKLLIVIKIAMYKLYIHYIYVSCT